MSKRPTTREEDLSNRRSQRAFYFVGGATLAGIGVVGGAWLGLFQENLLHPSVIAVCAGAVLLGLAMIFLGVRVKLAPTETLPSFESLPADDPRKARPLADRRRDWLLGVGIWVLGWVVVGLGLLGPFYALPGLLRLVAFLALPWASVALGAWFMRTRTGSTSWPSR